MMRAGRRAAAVLGLLGCLLLCRETALAAPNAVEQEQLQNAAGQKKQLEQEQARTEQRISELSGLKSDVSAYVEGLDQHLTEVAGELERLEGEIADKEAELAGTREELDQAERDAKQQYKDMKLRIKYMYEKGNTGFLELLFSSRNLSEFFNHAEYVQKISEYDRKQLDVYEAICVKIQDQQQRLEQEKAELEALRQNAAAKQDSLKILMAEKVQELSIYSEQIGEAQDELAEYKEQIAAQEAEIKAVEAAVKAREEEERRRAEEEERRRRAEEASRLAAGETIDPEEKKSSAAAKSIGDIRFSWPCPASSRVSSGYGRRSSPTKGASSFHQGIDIAAPTGTAIAAAAAGEVVTASYSRSAGNYVMIHHGGGVYTLYMHCSTLNVGQGERVSAGQTIAKVGSTGISTGPHLHFGVRAGGTYVNPAEYVSP